MATKILVVLLLCITRCAHTIIEVYPSTNLNETDTAVPLYLALIMSFGTTFNSSGTVPGVQVALDLINSDPHTLPGYRLHYILTDSQVSAFICSLLVTIVLFCMDIDVMYVPLFY